MMSGGPRVRSLNVADPEARPVLVPAGNKTRLAGPPRKPSPKPVKKSDSIETVEEERLPNGEERKDKVASAVLNSPPQLAPCLSAPSVLRRHDLLVRSNLSLNASCSSDASTDSFCSRASTGRIGRMHSAGRVRRHPVSPKPEKIAAKLEKIVLDGAGGSPSEIPSGKKRCAWVTPNADLCYAVFHDEEWGVPVHEDKKLFELLVLCGALAELTWPTILSKRQTFRQIFMDFDPVQVSKINEKKIVAPGSTAISLLSEPKLRGIIENARQILKIAEEFCSFDNYIWSFVNHKPIVSRFRYPRQVPVKTPKADVISKDLVRRGFRSVSPTVIYSFMQAGGLTNDHLISCFRFEICLAAAAAAATIAGDREEHITLTTNCTVKDKVDFTTDMELNGILELSMDMEGLSMPHSEEHIL